MKEMRRKDREIGSQETRQLIDSAGYGVMSTVGADGQPYGVPLNYVHRNNAIYFHCALTGHKLDNLASNPKASFCVVGQTKVLPERVTSAYESAMVFGTAAEVFGEERYEALLWLLEKYCPGHIPEGKQCIADEDKGTRVFKIEICRISGKALRES